MRITIPYNEERRRDMQALIKKGIRWDDQSGQDNVAVTTPDLTAQKLLYFLSLDGPLLDEEFIIDLYLDADTNWENNSDERCSTPRGRRSYAERQSRDFPSTYSVPPLVNNRLPGGAHSRKSEFRTEDRQTPVEWGERDMCVGLR